MRRGCGAKGAYQNSPTKKGSRNKMRLTLFLTWCALLVNNPYIMACLFGQILIVVTWLLGRYSKFIGVVIFLVYIGGIMILLSYCVMLLPSNKFWTLKKVEIGLFVLLFAKFSDIPIVSPCVFAYGLIYRARAIFLVALLLYLVMLSVVSMINYSRGMMKLYVQCDVVCRISHHTPTHSTSSL